MGGLLGGVEGRVAPRGVGRRDFSADSLVIVSGHGDNCNEGVTSEGGGVVTFELSACSPGAGMSDLAASAMTSNRSCSDRCPLAWLVLLLLVPALLVLLLLLVALLTEVAVEVVALPTGCEVVVVESSTRLSFRLLIEAAWSSVVLLFLEGK